MASPNTIIQLSAAGASLAAPVNFEGPNPYLGLQFVISGTGTYKVQFTQYDPEWENVNTYPDIYATLGLTGVFATDAVWNDLTGMTTMTSNTPGSITTPIRAIRLFATAYTSGTGTLIITQPSHR